MGKNYDVFSNEVRLFKKDGEIIWVRDNGKIIFDRNGDTAYINGVLEDITERILAEKVLKNYERIFATSSDHMALIDKNYVYLVVNDTYLKGQNKKREEIIGHSVPELFGEDVFRLKQKPNIDRCLTGEIIDYKLWIDFPTLGRLFMDVKHYPYFESDGTISGYVVNARDITKQKEAEDQKQKLEEQLQQAQKMEAIGTLAGGIAHDFNNILSVIMGYTDMTLKDHSNDEGVVHNLKRVMRASDRAKEMVEQILAFSRKSEQTMKSIDIGDVINETIDFLRSSIPTTIDIKYYIEKKLGLIFGNATQINQILMNLCTNAAYAMNERGGVLEICLKEVELDQDSLFKIDLDPGIYQNLTISDTGIGMSEEILERIFEPYFTTKQIDEGTGMGLAVIYGIVKNHGGIINVDSTPGKGTIFNVYFPVLETGETEELKTDQNPVIMGKGERVLFVDDEIILEELGTEMLKKLGYRVESRNSSIEALKAFKANPDKFDIVITDMTMPNMTGVNLAMEIHKINPDIPVVLCTGFSNEINKKNYKSKGISVLIMKPVIQSELGKAIRGVLDRSLRQ